MGMVLTDIYSLLPILFVALLLTGMVVFLEYGKKYAPSSLLKKGEWAVLIKMATIPVFIFILLLAKIAMDFPAEIFLYGRF